MPVRDAQGVAYERRTLSCPEFHALGTAWDGLVAADPHPTPFVTHPWIVTWWQHFGNEETELVVPSVWAGERLVAAVAITVRRTRTPLGSLRIAEIAGTAPVPTRGMGLADKADLLVAADHDAARAHLVTELLALLDRSDVLDLEGFDSDSPTIAALESLGHPRGRHLPRSSSPFAALPRAWPAFLESRSRNFRKEVRRKQRALRELGDVEQTRFTDPGDVPALMSEVQQVNARSWTAQRGTNLFRHPRLRDFFEDLVAAMAARGLLDLHLLRVAGSPVAYEICFDVSNRVFSYSGSFDLAMAEMSPGLLVTAAVVEDACKRERCEYDLLRGDEGYKSRWSDGTRRELTFLVSAPRWRARIHARWLRLRIRLKGIRWLTDLVDRASGLRWRWSANGDRPRP